MTTTRYRGALRKTFKEFRKQNLSDNSYRISGLALSTPDAGLAIT